MRKVDTQLDGLKKYFPKKAVEKQQIINNEIKKEKEKQIEPDGKFKQISLTFENVYTFIGTNSELDSNYFVLNLMALSSSLKQNNNLIINLNSKYNLNDFRRGVFIENIYNTEVGNLYLSNNHFTDKEELKKYIARINKLKKFDNIVILMNLENNFLDVFAYSNFNFIVTDVLSKNIIKLDKVLKILNEYKKINFGLFLIDIDTTIDNKNNIDFLINDFLPLYKNIYLVSLVFKHRILEMSRVRNSIAFKNINLINESHIFYEYTQIFNKFYYFTKEKEEWLQIQASKAKN